MSESKPKRDDVKVRRILRDLKPYRGLLIGGFVLLILTAPASVFHPLVWKFVTDDVLIGGHIDWLVPALAVMLAVQVTALVLGAWRDRLFARAGQRFVKDLRNRLYQKINRQSVRYHHDQRTGDLMSRVISDVDAMEQSVVSGIINLIEELVSFTLVLSAVMWINWRVGLVTIVPLTLAFLIVRMFNPRIRAIYRRAREILGEVSARLQDNLAGFVVIKGFNREAREEQRFEAVTQSHYDKTMEAVRLRTTVMPLVMFMSFTTNAVMLGLGAWFVYRGEFTIGGLMAFRGYWWQLNSPVRTLATVNDLLQRALASSRRVYEVLDAPVDLTDAPDAVEVRDARQPIAFENVRFAYSNGKIVFDNLSFTIRPGELVAVAGTSGAGKSTLISLVARFYDPLAGDIRIGQTPLRRVKQENWRAHLGMVFQDTFLFNESVRDNIRYARPDATEAELVAAAQQANAHEFITHLPQGYDTIIGERGVKLSGGQRQRIAVARAFLANPQVLLLDEPTSSVEPESESIIQQSLEKLMKGRTTILSSHRPSLLRDADRILFLHHGRIEEEGHHIELMARNGLYAKMYRAWEESAQADLDSPSKKLERMAQRLM
jgi:ABC-type multidrug transport system fused ATPase/permease subunit